MEISRLIVKNFKKKIFFEHGDRPNKLGTCTRGMYGYVSSHFRLQIRACDIKTILGVRSARQRVLGNCNKEFW